MKAKEYRDKAKELRDRVAEQRERLSKSSSFDRMTKDPIELEVIAAWYEREADRIEEGKLFPWEEE